MRSPPGLNPQNACDGGKGGMDFQSVRLWDGGCVSVTGGWNLQSVYVCVWPGGRAKGNRLNFTSEEATKVN